MYKGHGWKQEKQHTVKNFQSVYLDQNNHKIGLTWRMNSYESISVFFSPEINKMLTFRCQHTDDFTVADWHLTLLKNPSVSLFLLLLEIHLIYSHENSK